MLSCSGNVHKSNTQVLDGGGGVCVRACVHVYVCVSRYILHAYMCNFEHTSINMFYYCYYFYY